MRNVATYAALRQLGREGVASLIEQSCEQAQAIVHGIGTLPGAEMLWKPQINQGLVTFLDPSMDADEGDHDRFTDYVIAAILASGDTFFTATTCPVVERCV